MLVVELQAVSLPFSRGFLAPFLGQHGFQHRRLFTQHVVVHVHGDGSISLHLLVGKYADGYLLMAALALLLPPSALPLVLRRAGVHAVCLGLYENNGQEQECSDMDKIWPHTCKH